MRKKCEKCGKEFEASQAHFKWCPQCAQQSGQRTSLPELLLNSYHDSGGNILKKVYIDIPQQLGEIFANAKPELKPKQLRDFHQKILSSRNKALLKGIGAARPILYKCQTDVEYQLERRVIPDSFARFMKHHLALAERDEKSLEGFFEHLDAIVCFFPVSK